ncbi:hypothetical protein CCP1ISM_160009 [Azospirillaceae bacterium]
MEKEFNSEYISDELVSSRITINNGRVEVKYYHVNDIAPFWKFWINRCEIANNKNKLLWLEACNFGKVKGLPPIFPPLKWSSA